jgi:hypothetical protein
MPAANATGAAVLLHRFIAFIAPQITLLEV